MVRLRVLAVLLPCVFGAGSLGADNMLPAGRFDQATDVAAFAPDGSDALIAYVDALDADDCGPSGAASITNASSSGLDVVNFRACVTGIVPGIEYRYGFSAYFTPQTQNAEIWSELQYYEQSDCTFPVGDTEFTLSALSSSTFTWLPREDFLLAPAGAVAARVTLALYKISSASSNFGVVDEVFIRRRNEIFDDGFDIGSTCRWSSAAL